MKNALWAIVAVVVIGGGIWWWTMSDSSMNNTNTAVNEGAETVAPGAETPATGVTTPGSEVTESAPMSVTVTYDGSSYTPKDVTIKKGGTVTWKNASDGKMWVASAQHPSHTVYDGNSRSEHCAAGYTGAKPFDQCAGGTDYSFTFDKAGKHGYHDHINASAFGAVTVIE